MSRALAVFNRQRDFFINCRLLKKIIQLSLVEQLRVEDFSLDINLVSPSEMAHLNETFLHHPGATDVITFNYADSAQPKALQGEIFVCVDIARTQARQYRTTWQSELVRYSVHGILHLLGFDDHAATDRRRMKKQENRALLFLQAQFNLRAIGTTK